MITFEIVGEPMQQGSKTRMPNGAMIEGGPQSAESRQRRKSWRTAVAEAARDAAQNLPEPLDGPLALSVEFRFTMPKSRPKAAREAGRWPKTTTPDLDKLVRALGDGLEAGGLVRSDARFAVIEASKVEVIGWTGAVVSIEALDWPEVAA